MAQARASGLVGAPALASLLAEAERISAEERQAPFWRRRTRSAAAWARVAERSAELHAELRLTRRRDIENWRQLSGEAETALARARKQLSDPGLGAAEAHLLLKASTLLGQARLLAEAGQVRSAAEAALRALEAAGTVDDAWAGLHRRFDDPQLRAQWQGWVRQSLLEAEGRGQPLIVVDKLRRRLDVLAEGRLQESFAVELGANGLVRKLHAGDRATPEGMYRVKERREGGATRYYKALLLDYPNPEDLMRWRRALSLGGPPASPGPGGLIEIHGEGGRGRDWTDGCVALSNPDIDRLFEMAAVGSPVTIVGTYESAEMVQ